MADIHITQQHALSLGDSKQAAQQVVDQMAAEFDMTTHWDGDVLTFERGGVAGTLALREGQAQLDVTLGMLFAAFAPVIEEKMTRKMAKAFGTAT